MRRDGAGSAPLPKAAVVVAFGVGKLDSEVAAGDAGGSKLGELGRALSLYRGEEVDVLDRI